MPVAAPFTVKVEPLGPYPDRTGFTCGIESLTRYSRMQAGQNGKRTTNGVFVLIDPHQPNEVLGYYTLRATALVHGDVPIEARRYLPRYPLIRATLVGRLSVASAYQKQGLGALLLA